MCRLKNNKPSNVIKTKSNFERFNDIYLNYPVSTYSAMKGEIKTEKMKFVKWDGNNRIFKNKKGNLISVNELGEIDEI